MHFVRHFSYCDLGSDHILMGVSVAILILRVCVCVCVCVCLCVSVCVCFVTLVFRTRQIFSTVLLENVFCRCRRQVILQILLEFDQLMMSESQKHRLSNQRRHLFLTSILLAPL